MMKALAAGHSYDEIKAFDDQIHAHGDDPRWLTERIAPVQLEAVSSQTAGTGYKGVGWDQGMHDTCVAASTVTARAMVDPLFAFQLTTGGHPDDPAYDNGPASKERWEKETNRVYDTRSVMHLWKGGMWDWESQDVADDEIAKHTGADYHTVDLDSRDKRQNALAEIEQKIDEGKPVPLSVHGGTLFDPHGHQMMIIGHRGDQLEIYNPWGYTVWVSESDFINNHMQGASDDRHPEVRSVRMPK
ncbi:cysteine peptidase family C39 domain-containing protein [Kitasatospora cathayae]|uniref:Peptidase C39-like domain-containing protein n=1 Tax=Kitasatospora cathayae TaxID=3004092 RepID=A0ABY7QH22_9ACTN|nr:hypothetical protein [Kitasatospora sp. HUAS 3-15]WBP92045.1 hypothetical protein O1G21_40375 [Kitasatospora sp. HUAS 3-15]